MSERNPKLSFQIIVDYNFPECRSDSFVINTEPPADDRNPYLETELRRLETGTGTE